MAVDLRGSGPARPSVKRREDAFSIFVGHARSLVLDRQPHCGFVGRQVSAHQRAAAMLPGIFKQVPNQVTQQNFVARNGGTLRALHLGARTGGLLIDQHAQIDGDQRARRNPSIRAGHQQHVLDERVELDDVAVNISNEALPAFGIRFLAYQFKSHPQPRQGRAQLVRRVREGLPLLRQQQIDSLRRLIECRRQGRDLVAA
jgi:hypothetical protein